MDVLFCLEWVEVWLKRSEGLGFSVQARSTCTLELWRWRLCVKPTDRSRNSQMLILSLFQGWRGEEPPAEPRPAPPPPGASDSPCSPHPLLSQVRLLWGRDLYLRQAEGPSL